LAALPNGVILIVEIDNKLILYDFFSGMAFALIKGKKCLMMPKYLDTEEVKHGN